MTKQEQKPIILCWYDNFGHISAISSSVLDSWVFVLSMPTADAALLIPAVAFCFIVDNVDAMINW